MRLLRSWYYERRAKFLLRRIRNLLVQYKDAVQSGDAWAEGFIRAQINEADSALTVVLDRWDALNAAIRADLAARRAA